MRTSTRARLLMAGWRPNRDYFDRVKLVESLPLFPAAEQILRAFGGLVIGVRNDLVKINPVLAHEVAADVRQYATILGRDLYPLGVLEHQDSHYILVDSAGTIYTLVDQLQPLATSFDRAIDYLVRGKAEKSAVEADLDSIGLRGKCWRLNAAEPTQNHKVV